MAPEGALLPPPPQGPGGAAPTRGTPRLLITGIVIASVLALGICGGCGYLAYKAFKGFGIGSATAPPDFPVYPGSTPSASFSMNPGSRVGKTTVIQWTTSADLPQVESFYSSALNQGDWAIVSRRSETQFFFRRRSTGNPSGILQVQRQPFQSVTIIQMITSEGSEFPRQLEISPPP